MLKGKDIFSYQHPSPYQNIEKYAHHFLFALSPFRQEEDLKCSSTVTSFAKIQEPSVMNVTDRNKSIIEPYNVMVG